MSDATIRVARSHLVLNARLADFEVFLNGVRRARIKNELSAMISVDPGEIERQATIDSRRRQTERIEFTAHAGDSIKVKGEPT